MPTSVRDAMGLSAGTEVDVVFTEGRIEIELAPAEVAVEVDDGLPRLRPRRELPPLTDRQVRDTIDATRR